MGVFTSLFHPSASFRTSSRSRFESVDWRGVGLLVLSGGMNEHELARMMAKKEVLRVSGVVESTLWRWEKQGLSPRRRQIGPGRVAWREDAVCAWLDSSPSTGEAA